ncbi:hypothetical protein AAMO2058_001384000 [Amorphochlora amoebiformis]|mmetsp:Transcript_6358/g.9766  ORF Transcript_6358/g.9766 Transcript_6358/m.9766 type:complete len:351 (-) Transcript_6358:22-1074(-)
MPKKGRKRSEVPHGGKRNEKGEAPTKKARSSSKKGGTSYVPKSFALDGISSRPDSKEPGSLTIATYNVNGLKSLMEKYQDLFIEYLSKENPDVLCIQETKMSADQTKEMESTLMKRLPQYKVYWHCCTKKKGYSGTAILSKTKPISVIKDTDIDDEGRLISIEFESVVIVCTYVPNSGLKLERLKYRTETWDPAFREKLVNLDKKKPIVWCGDLNVAHGDVDVANWKAKRNKVPGFCDAERENFGIIVGGEGPITEKVRSKRTLPAGRPGEKGSGLGFVDAWRHLNPYDGDIGYTFWSYRFAAKQKNNGWRLDYFVVSERIKDCIKEVSRREEMWGASDHVPLVLTLKNL